VAKFKVQLERPCANDGRPKNPFLIADIFNPNYRLRSLVREWEIEAKDEAEVRELVRQAHEADIDNVRGFRLRQIERVKEPTVDGEVKP
jgi:hypothetical protein